MKYIIDTDPGIDDAIAIMMAVINKLDIIGFCLATGNVDPASSENNIKVIENILNSDIKIYKGKNVNKSNSYAPFAHGEDGLGNTFFPKQDREIEKKSAEEFIIESSEKYKDELSIICLGPLTNLASAIKEDKSIVNKISKVYIMGTSYDESRDDIYDEFNISVDPDSAKDVLTAGFKEINLVTHEVGAKSFIENDYMDSLKDASSPISRFTYLISRKYIEFSKEYNNIIGLSTPDPTTVAAVIDEKIVSFRPCNVVMENKKCKVTLCNNSNIYVSTDFSLERFRELFKKTFPNNKTSG